MPQVVAYKKSEHGNEGDTGVLTCKNPSFPPVSSWTWSRNGEQVGAVSVLAPLLPTLLTNKEAEDLLHQN